VAKALETRRISREFVVPEVARAHAGRNHQIIERDLMDAGAWGGRFDRAGSNVHAGDLRQEYGDVSLLRLKLTNRRSDLGGREDRRGHLIEKRVRYVMVAAGGQGGLGLWGAKRGVSARHRDNAP